MCLLSVFRVKGEYRAKNKKIPFAKEVKALKEAHAIEKILSLIGSKHRVPRNFIKITEIKQIQTDEITDPIIKSITSELSRI
ncbi:MAG: 50S ribosomal protein L18Ae [Promethearchaeota archaeon]